MGIPFLYGSWLRSKKYSAVLRKRLPKGPSTFSVDANAIIYVALEIVLGTGDFEDKERQEYIQTISAKDVELEIQMVTVAIINNLVIDVKPTEAVIIAFDGPTPMGKVQHQKERRYKAAILREQEPLFDTNIVTPGTNFMRDLDELIQQSFQTLYETMGVKLVIYSSHMVPGEGEHKIFQHLKTKYQDSSSHVIYGMDADLILLSLVSGLSGVVLARDSIRISVRDSTGRSIITQKNVRKGKGDDNRNIYIDDLKSALELEMRNDTTAVYDFTVMVTMLGNDFLPHPPTLRELAGVVDKMITLYRDHNLRITDGSNINWKDFLAFLNILGQLEPELINDFGKRKLANPSRMIEVARNKNRSVDYVKFRNAWYTNALGRGMSTTHIVNMCYQFMRGVNWTLQYYTKGQDHVTWLWYYPYHHAPLIQDMANVLGQLNVNDIPGLFNVGPIAGEVRYSALHQLISVIPRLSHRHLPQLLHSLYQQDSPLKHLMPDAFVIEMDGTWKDWQGIPLIPKADYDLVIRTVHSMGIPANEWANWLPADDVYVTMNEKDFEDLMTQRKFQQRLDKQRKARERWMERRDIEIQEQESKQRRITSKPPPRTNKKKKRNPKPIPKGKWSKKEKLM